MTTQLSHISLQGWHQNQSKWIVVCFFGDLYCTEGNLQGKFLVSNKNLVSIDIEEFWYRTSNIPIGIEEFQYQPAILLLHTVLLLGTVLYVNIRLNYNVSIEQNSGIDRCRTKPGIEPALIYIQVYFHTKQVPGTTGTHTII